MLLVTGGAGFIGANFVVSTVAHTGEEVINLDKLTYAGNVRNLDELRGDRRHNFVQGDIADRALVRRPRRLLGSSRCGARLRRISVPSASRR